MVYRIIRSEGMSQGFFNSTGNRSPHVLVLREGRIAVTDPKTPKNSTYPHWPVLTRPQVDGFNLPGDSKITQTAERYMEQSRSSKKKNISRYGKFT